ncbi:MAG: NUDIX hydrolase [Ardenticatenaceae bacterium]
MEPWKTRSRSIVLDYGKFLKVENHVVELPDGRLIEDWAWVITPDYINVVAITHDGLFLCFRQTKYAVEGTTLGFVGGYIEPDEAPLLAAQRELLEETGYEASQWIELGQYRVDSNRGAGMAYLFLALDARPIAEPDSDDLEEQQLLLLTRSQIEEALSAGEFKVLPWAAAGALALRHLPATE